MMKKIILICSLFLLTSCGYSILYSSKNSSNILINKIETVGEEKINRQILTLLSLDEVGELENSYILNINTKKNKRIISKDKQGNASVYNLNLEINISLNKDNQKIEKTFISDFTYNTQKNKFELSREENKILNNLVESVVEKIILFINAQE
jgi:outer membrane lipopolysaccharide assembly protein LptE/RlpB